jgi:hypothetical protein
MPTKHPSTDPDTPTATAPTMTKVTINMPTQLHEELRQRAHSRGISVTELMRRAVALDKLVFEEHAEVFLRDPETGQKQLLRVL